MNLANILENEIAQALTDIAEVERDNFNARITVFSDNRYCALDDNGCVTLYMHEVGTIAAIHRNPACYIISDLTAKYNGDKNIFNDFVNMFTDRFTPHFTYTYNRPDEYTENCDETR